MRRVGRYLMIAGVLLWLSSFALLFTPSWRVVSGAGACMLPIGLIIWIIGFVTGRIDARRVSPEDAARSAAPPSWMDR